MTKIVFPSCWTKRLPAPSEFFVAGFFLIYFLIGLNVFKDYGISADDVASRNNGLSSVQFIEHPHETHLITDNDARYHGPAFEIALYLLERCAIPVQNFRAIFEFRHFSIFLLFYVSVIFFYKICVHYFRDWKWGLLGCLFLVVNPRIFANAFFNPRDLPFLSVFIISVYTLLQFLEKRDLKYALLHALACAILIDIRIPGVIVPFLTILLFCVPAHRPAQSGPKRDGVVGTIYLLWLALLVYAFWPTLWVETPGRFFSILKLMSRYTEYQWTVLYMGQFIPARDLPWHYAPVWIAITTPLSYLLLFLIGIGTLGIRMLKAPLCFVRANQTDFIFLCWFTAPLAAVVIAKSVIYDGWRHLFFVYPALVLIGLVGMKTLFQFVQKIALPRGRFFVQLGTAGLIAVNVLGTALFMVRNHPFEYVYFNRLGGASMPEISKKFEMDYWGLAFREGLEYLLKIEQGEAIRFNASLDYTYHALLFPPRDANRLVICLPDEADYYLTNYRYQREDEVRAVLGKEIYAQSVDRAKIFGIFKLDPSAGPVGLFKIPYRDSK